MVITVALSATSVDGTSPSPGTVTLVRDCPLCINALRRLYAARMIARLVALELMSSAVSSAALREILKVFSPGESTRSVFKGNCQFQSFICWYASNECQMYPLQRRAYLLPGTFIEGKIRAHYCSGLFCVYLALIANGLRHNFLM